jgi:hypothetical protein
MSYLRQLCAAIVLMCACACSIYAGDIECTGLQAAAPATTAGQMSTMPASDGQMSTPVAAPGEIECGGVVIITSLLHSLFPVC